MSIVRVLARPMLASTFIISGVDRLRNADETAAQLSPVLGKVSKSLPINTDEKTLARVVGGAQVGAGVLLAAGKFSRLAAVVLSLTSVLNTVVEYRTADTTTKEGRQHRRSQLLKNVALSGGVLLAAVDTAGRPGLAWRAGKFAKAGKKATSKQLKQVDKSARNIINHATEQ